MKKWMQGALWALLGLALLGAAAVMIGLRMADRRLDRVIDVSVQPVAIPTDTAAVERGRYLYNSRGCADCHGAGGGGERFVDSGGVRLAGPDITSSPDSVTRAYQPVDWVRTIRHGVKPDGRAARVMPSQEFNRLTDADVGALVAYVRSLPPAGGAKAVIELPLIARVMLGFGQLPSAADQIDHRLPPAQPVPESVSVEHGRYVAAMCIGCHGPQLAGGHIPGTPPDWPDAPRLAGGEGSVMPRYASADDLARMFKTGRRADGSEVRIMPFAALKQMNDTDVKALHLYLSSQQAQAQAGAKPGAQATGG